MHLSPDVTQACWELGSAVFGLLNIRAIRRSRSIAGVHWAPTVFFFGWGVYNLWFYTALHLPWAWWAGLAITAVNFAWLGHVAWYASHPAPQKYDVPYVAHGFLEGLAELRRRSDY